MKILYIITKSEIGGAQTHVDSLVQSACSAGHDVWVMAGSDGWLLATVRNYGATTIINPFLSNNLNPFTLYRAVDYTRMSIKEIQPDLVHLHSATGGLVGRLATSKKIPTVYTVHGWGFTHGAPTWRRVLAWVVEQICAPFTHKIICVSRYDYNLALRYGIAKSVQLVCIHNGVEIPKMHAPVFSEKSKLKLLFVGRLAPPKDLVIIFRAIAMLPLESRLRIELVVMGDGPQRDFFIKMSEQLGVANLVRFVGELHRNEKDAIFCRSDVLILTSHWEALPMTIIESFSYGIPVLASTVGGVPELVDDSVGRLLPNDRTQPVVLAEVIENIIVEPMQWRARGEVARKRAQDKFSKKQMVRKVFELYDSVVVNI